MANRHKGKGGREKIYGKDQVFASAKKGTVKGAIFKQDGGAVVGKAAGGPGRVARARGGRTGGGSSPFSSAAFFRGGAVKGGNSRS